MLDLKWSPSETVVARRIFDQALNTEMRNLVAEAKRMAATIEDASELWDLESWLTQRRLEIDRKYDYRYSLLPLVFATLLQQGRITERLNQALAGHSPVSILAQLTNRFLFIRRDEFHDESSEVNRHHAYIEFLTGLLVSRSFPTGDVKELTVAHRDEIWPRLQDYYLAVERDLMADRLKTEDRLHSLAFDSKNYSLRVRGEAYPHQLEQMATRLYGEHDEWFEKTLGFTIRQALHAFHVAMALSEWRRDQVRSSAEDPALQTDALERYGEEILGFTIEDLGRASELPRQVCESLLKRLSQDFGYRNSQYPDTFLDAKKAPWDFNALYERPFIHHEGRYFIFVPPLVRTALFKTFWFDLQSDKAYSETFKAAQGRWLEREVAERLGKVFGPNSVFVNAKKANKGREELSDVLVLYDRNILIVQCKSKGLRHASKTERTMMR